MNDLIETWKSLPKRPRTLAAVSRAILVHIYPPGLAMGARYVLEGRPLTIGRANTCDIRIPDSSVSRQHARIEPDPEGYQVVDLQSMNGTFVNDRASIDGRLKDGDYLRVGNCIYRFLTGDNVEAAYHEEIYRRTIVDALTDIHNKRYLLEYLEREIARAARFKRPLALAMFDIDHFKKINDDMGHLAGDATLRELAACVKTGVRKEEEFARYGGDEFAIVLPETGVEGGRLFAERIRALVEKSPFIFENKSYLVTISIGLAVWSGESKISASELIRLADQKLYQAKQAGRNCVAS